MKNYRTDINEMIENEKATKKFYSDEQAKFRAQELEEREYLSQFKKLDEMDDDDLADFIREGHEVITWAYLKPYVIRYEEGEFRSFRDGKLDSTSRKYIGCLDGFSSMKDHGFYTK